MARLYFDGIRSRLFEYHGWYELGQATEIESVKTWCAVRGVEFVDHRIENYPAWMREPLLRARAVHGQDYPWMGLWLLGRERRPVNASGNAVVW